MANYAYLSFWFRDFTIEKGLEHLQAMLALFPASPARPGFRLAIRSLDASQSSSVEAELAAAPETIRAAAGEFLHNDTAYEVTAYWDLWQPRGKKQCTRSPSGVEFILQGEEFDEGRYRETGHVCIALGPEEFYLESEGPGEVPLPYLRENVGQLYAFLRPVEGGLPVAKRRLWSEGKPSFDRQTEALLATRARPPGSRRPSR